MGSYGRTLNIMNEASESYILSLISIKNIKSREVLIY